MAHIRLGELLIDAGVINETQLGKALAIQKKTRNRLGDILIENIKQATMEELMSVHGITGKNARAIQEYFD